MITLMTVMEIMLFPLLGIFPQLLLLVLMMNVMMMMMVTLMETEIVLLMMTMIISMTCLFVNLMEKVKILVR